jgi:hypothetical protein
MITIVRTTAAVAATLAVALTAGGPAGAAAESRPARGVIARFAPDQCVLPSAPVACRGHQVYAGTLVSTQPTTRVLHVERDASTGRIRFRGVEGFTGCVAGRCGTLRFALVGSFRLDRAGRPAGSGRARVTRSAGELTGTTGSFAFTLGYPASYQGVLHLPGDGE